MDKNILELNNVSKNFRKKTVLENISFSVKEGERIAIIGNNGCGKTTLVKIIAKIIPLSSGEIKYPIWKKDEVSKKIGIQFQENKTSEILNVRDLILFFSELNNEKLSDEDLEKLLQKFRLTKVKKRKIKKLSGGEKQRLNIILSLINKPELLILDELTNNLDIYAQEDITSYIDDYISKKNKTLLLISHNSNEIFKLADRIIVIHENKIFEDVLKKDILKKYNNDFSKYTQELFSKKLN